MWFSVVSCHMVHVKAVVVSIWHLLAQTEALVTIQSPMLEKEQYQVLDFFALAKYSGGPAWTIIPCVHVWNIVLQAHSKWVLIFLA